MARFSVANFNPSGLLADAEERMSYGQASLILPKSMVNLDMHEHTKDCPRRKCKIICTMGPSCWDVDKLVQLIDCGMNICRLNFSHGDHAAHGACVQRIREAAKQRPDKHIAILLDTKGPEIRTGFFKEGVDKIHLKAGQDLKLVTDYSFKGDETTLAVSYDKMPTSVKAGGQILCADGSLVLKVKSCGADFVMTEVMNSCSIGERKNCNLPGVHVDLPVLQEKDKKDLVDFGIVHGVDFVAASFVQSADDVKEIRQVLGEAGKKIKIISKIENQAGLENFDDILEEGDGIMVARGDLGMEIPPEKVFEAQKVMIAKCNFAGKPVVTATQMLESMTKAPRPTRAEAGDVANAVLDGTDCVMLSGETAGGSFPVESVTIMRRIVEEAESTLNYDRMFTKMRLETLKKGQQLDTSETTAAACVMTAMDVHASLIVVMTGSGRAARHVCKYRPETPIIACSSHPDVVRQVSCLRGVIPHLTQSKSTDEAVKEVIDHAFEMGLVKAGDIVVTVQSQSADTLLEKGISNLIKIITVPGPVHVEPPKLENVQSYSQANLFLPKELGNLDLAEHTEDSFNRKCKIICTMGPSCWDVDKLVTLIDCGMNIARLNFSHGDHEAHGACVQRIREAAKQRPDKQVGILLDTKGPEIRTGFFAAGGKVSLKAGQDLKLVTDYSFKGDSTCIAVTYEKLPTSVKPGSQILCADGSLVLKVKTCGADHVVCEVMNDCSMGERKNCNLPGVKVDLPVLQDKDKKDIVEFGLVQKVDFVAASFVQSAEDVAIIRGVLGEAGKGIKIISKIENRAGLENFDAICAASDGIMVARGDLGMEIPPEKVFLAQKIMIAKCNLQGKPVVTATQMLESMTGAPRPTRAEAGDVANAVLDGTDVVMLSGETAGGDFPVEAVTTMRKIVEEAETNLDYLTISVNMHAAVLNNSPTGRMSAVEAMASTAVKTSLDSGAPLIMVLTAGGTTVRHVSKYRPKAVVLAVTNSAETARSLLCSRGVLSFVTSLDDDVNVIATRAMEYAKRVGIKKVKTGANVIMISEQRDGSQGAGVDAKLIKIITVP